MNEILNINNVHGYLDKETGTAYLNAEDKALNEVEAALIRGFTKEDHEALVRAKYYFEAYESIGVLTKTDWMYLVHRVLKSAVTSPPAGIKYR